MVPGHVAGALASSLRVTTALALSMLLVAGASSSAGAVEADGSGELALSLRYFPREARYPKQQLLPVQASAELRPRLVLHFDEQEMQTLAAVESFTRLDSQDERRNHSDLREAHWLIYGDHWAFKFGVTTEFWGVLEGRHVVDILNQIDMVENFAQTEKLGQPLASLQWRDKSFGSLTGYVLPFFRERTFPGASGRFRGPLVVDVSEPSFESRDRQRHIDLAARYGVSIGVLDLGLSYFRGTSREPRFLLQSDQLGRSYLAPRYDLIDQYGFDIQATFDELLLKLESIARSAREYAFTAAGVGVEYSFFGAFAESADLIVFGEYFHDRRPLSAPPILHDRDAFYGLRLILNDTRNTEFTLAGLTDVRNGASFATVLGRSRIEANWVLEGEVTVLPGSAHDLILSAVARDSYGALRLVRYF